MSKSNSKESFNLAGRGVLSGLLSNQQPSRVRNKDAAAEWISVDQIVRSPFQPRQFFAQESIDQWH